MKKANDRDIIARSLENMADELYDQQSRGLRSSEVSLETLISILHMLAEDIRCSKEVRT